MIQIRALRIEEFRGIRELDLQLSEKPFVVWGPNGSGKSGVVDAIDFALTGTIARLSGSGTSGISVLKHAPHVHHRDNPAAAKVVLTIHDPVTGQNATLERCVKTANRFTLSPSTTEMLAAVTEAQNHPELTLSRREIIRYVVAEAGKRAQEVQALLKLDRLDDIRRLLRTSLNQTSSVLTVAEGELTGAEASMLRHLDLPELLSEEMTAEVNKRRAVIGLNPIDTVTIHSDLLEGSSQADKAAPFDKLGALRDLHALTAAIEHPDQLTAAVGGLDAVLGELAADPDIMISLRHRSLVESGLDLATNATCPLCDLDWPDVESLRTHLQAKLVRSQAADALRHRILGAAAAVASALRAIRDLSRIAYRHTSSSSDLELPHRLQTWTDDLTHLEAELGNLDGIVGQRTRLSSGALALPPDVGAGLAQLITDLDAMPDQSADATARSYLIVAEERWTRVRVARAGHAKALAAQTTARTVYNTYCAVVDEALTTLYKTVEDDFSSYYRQINSDDESTFTAELSPSSGKLDLAVDFYGLGKFPPAAYHSEGHQDGMGVCLYLALVKQLLGDDFRFAVLDDVVMSVDSSHRRQFCKLLKDTFPNVQFIITTHDQVWVRQMQTSGLIDRRSQAHFHGWSVDGGPIYEQGGDVWTRIKADLANDDVPSAAARLRRYLEAATADIAESIGGRVPYRSDASYDLGELLSPVKGRHSDLLTKAGKSAAAWDNEQAKQIVQALKDERSQVIPAQETVSWAINKLVHNNDWATMSSADFQPVVDASKKFLALFQCQTCHGTIFVVGQSGNEDSLRCSCGSYNLNLRTK